MMVLDELQIDANGDIELWVIPPDEESLEQELLVPCVQGSRMHDWVEANCLRPIVRELGLESRVASLVHGGEDTYTIRTVDEQFVEVNRLTHPGVVQVIEELAETAGKLALLEANNGGPAQGASGGVKRGRGGPT